MKILLNIFIFLTTLSFYSQNNQITVKAKLFVKANTLEIQQQITYYNTSKDTLQKIVLRNWANSYKNPNTPLAKRLLEDYKTDFYFSRKNARGFATIKSLNATSQTVSHEIYNHDLIFVQLTQKLAPKTSIVLNLNYTVKLPNTKFTGNGNKGVDYYLEDWHITPAIYKNKWILDHHKNLNYHYLPPTNYNITLTTPLGYSLFSNFNTVKTIQAKETVFTLTGTHTTNTNISLPFVKSYLNTTTPTYTVYTNFIAKNLYTDVQQSKIKKMLAFLESYLGKPAHKNILIEKNTYNKNPIYELKYLPKGLDPYPKEFKWEMQFFKALTSQYIQQLVLTNNNTDYWFNQGLAVYLFQEYLEQNYTNTKLLGKLSNLWGVRKMHLSKQKFGDKFKMLHQITARENLDQSLTTPIAKLSNYNKKVVSPYKAGIGFNYLKAYVGKKTLDKSIYEFVNANRNTTTHSKLFLQTLQSNTPKNISWFQTDWLDTQHKIDHKIVATDFTKDSVYVTLKNNRSVKTPVLVYGLQHKTIKSKTWFDGFSGTKKIALKNDSINKVVLNYENIYPEINPKNNWKHKKSKLFKRPVQLSLFKDLNNPQKNQIFVNPEADYNFYDGLILGISLQNKAILKQNFEYSVKPTYSTRSNTFTGGFNINYALYPENTNIYNLNLGVGGSNYHYAPELNYNTLSPYVSLSFKQKNFRAIGTNKLSARYIFIDKEIEAGQLKSDEDRYNLFKLDYLFKANKLIHDYQFNANTEIATKFSKLNIDFRYRHLTNKKRPIEFRFFGGVFLTNKTNGDYFSFNQHTANDYLFELPYLGRSENSGILSQQYFKAQGGFVTQNNPGFANQWLTSINTSIGIVRWVEAFNNVSLLKNRNSTAFFDYEGGIRLNFVPNILEIYVPIYNREGLVLQQDNYLSNIRFVLTLHPQPILKFLKQQLF